MSTPEIWSTIAFFSICLVCYLVYGARSSADLHDTNSGELLELYDLPSQNSLGPGECHAVLVRQSGNVYRDLGVFPTASKAITEAAKSFRRAGIDRIRITHSDEFSLAVYRDVYNFKGRSEGKKLAGATFRVVRSAPNSPIDFLEISLREAQNTSGTKWQVHFNYRCKKCGGTKIEVPDEKLDESLVYCKGCGHVFGTFLELRSLSNKKAEAHVLRLEAKRLSPIKNRI